MATEPFMIMPVPAPVPTPTADPAAVTASRHEVQLSRLLVGWISVGLVFMLLPGTFLGVWNLISIAGRRAAGSVSPAWIQAHGHAQVFGWIGSFILGIGFYSLPKLLRGRPFRLWRAWSCLALWSAGVGLRWVSSVYAWHWRWMLPLSAGLELVSFLIFLRAVTGHSRSGHAANPETWMRAVVSATFGFLLALTTNLGACVYLALRGAEPAFPLAFDQRFLVLMTWGFLVPFVWGFSGRWLPVFLGLKPLRSRALIAAVVLDASAVAAALAGAMVICTLLTAVAAAMATLALRMFEPAARPAKTRGVHVSFPWFIRLAYVWLVIASGLGIWAAISPNANGIWGASRHALTVGFLAMMVFGVGQRILPAFSGMRHLFSTRLMFASMALLILGCSLRVTAEVLAYQGYLSSAWSWLPLSAGLELCAVTLFAVNLAASFAQPAPATNIVGAVRATSET